MTLLSCCLKKINKSLESNIILPITHPPQTNPYAPIPDIWQHSDPSGAHSLLWGCSKSRIWVTTGGFSFISFSISSFVETATTVPLFEQGSYLFIYLFPQEETWKGREKLNEEHISSPLAAHQHCMVNEHTARGITQEKFGKDMREKINAHHHVLTFFLSLLHHTPISLLWQTYSDLQKQILHVAS